MSLILNIETSSYVCSVVLARDGELLAIRESRQDKTHAALLTSYIKELFKETDIGANQLNAVAVSKGPGSYTGLRIGVSAAKGICYGADLPLISVCSLNSMAAGILENEAFKKIDLKDALLCPMIDARRMEVYTAFFDVKGNQLSEINAAILNDESYTGELETKNMVFFGNGSSKSKIHLRHKNAHFIDDFHPSARFMIALAEEAFQYKKFEDTAYFEPFYLKDFIPTTPKKNLVQNR